MTVTLATIALQQSEGFWGDVPYAASRLWFTLGFMIVVVSVAVWVVRRRFANQLLAELAGTLGIFLVVIGSIVYTVAFRGLRPLEMVVAWIFSLGAIVWFVMRLDRIMSRPLALLETLGSAIRRGDWGALMAYDARSPRERDVRAALKDVALLVGETRKTTDAVLASSADVARIGGTVADGATAAATSLAQLTTGAAQGTEAGQRIRAAATQIGEAAAAVHNAARETLTLSTSVEENARNGVTRAGDATRAVAEIAELARDLIGRIEGLREASETISEITNVVSGIGRQTNLLALNASIEAARAGSYGRGFAVVAEEVGKLATQSGGAMHRVDELVRQMTERTEGAAGQVRRMGRAVTSGEQVMQDALAVFRAIEADAQRTQALAETVVQASERHDAMSGELEQASAMVANAASASARGTEAAAAAVARQRSLTDELRDTAQRLQQSAQSLDEVVTRFSGVRG
jgi:methyl-accepting chemotaxis protein